MYHISVWKNNKLLLTFNGLFVTVALIVKAKSFFSAALLLQPPEALSESRRVQLRCTKLIMPNLKTQDSTSNGAKKKAQTSLSSWLPPSKKQRDSSYIIFCDLDGVLVDFDAGVRKLCRGKGPNEIERSSTMWSAIAKAERFYYHLPWMSDGKMLWNSIRHLSPNILTGVPMFKKSRQDKAEWCKRELGLTTNHVDMAGPKGSHETVQGRKINSDHTVNVITCWSRNKHFESGVNTVLIDDRIELSKAWTDKGGIFIHHIDTKSTLQKLVERGILRSPAVDSGYVHVQSNNDVS